MSAIKERQEKLDDDFGIMKQEVIGIKQDVEMLMQQTTEIGQEVRELKAETGLQLEGEVTNGDNIDVICSRLDLQGVHLLQIMDGGT